MTFWRSVDIATARRVGQVAGARRGRRSEVGSSGSAGATPLRIHADTEAKGRQAIDDCKHNGRVSISTKSLYRREIITAVLAVFIPYTLPSTPRSKKNYHNTYSKDPVKRRFLSNYSMLIFIRPSFVSVMPCKPILFGPNIGVMLILPPLFERSPCE